MFSRSPQSELLGSMPGPIAFYVKWVDAASFRFGRIAMYTIFAMIGVLLLGAVMRNVVQIPLSWTVEMAQFLLAGYYIVGGPYSMQVGEHVRMDLFYDRLGPRGKARMDAVTSFCLLFYLVCLLVGAISSTSYAIEFNEKKFSMWNPSMVPIKIIMTCGITLMLMQALSIFFKDCARGWSRHPIVRQGEEA